VNQLDKIAALLKAAPAIRLYRDGGLTWAEICQKAPKTCNPLGLSTRQIQRIYEGGDAYSWLHMKHVVDGLDWAALYPNRKF